MYIPPCHALADLDAMWSYVDANALGTWVCLSDSGLVANHLPLVLDRTSGPRGRLMGHVARANPVWRELVEGRPSVVTFLGPQSYISPGWYPGKAQHGKVVPTWNYIAVHAHGRATAVEDPGWMLDMLNRLTDAQESGQPKPWKVSDAPEAYIRTMLRAVGGIEIQVQKWEGRMKLSQDEDHQDRLGTVHGLVQTGDSRKADLAAQVQAAMQGEQKAPR